jgi:hypothetical protein
LQKCCLSARFNWRQTLKHTSPPPPPCRNDVGEADDETKNNNERQQMWLCTVRGFYSVVKKGAPPNNFQVRARTRQDIDNLCGIIDIPTSRVLTSRDSDYAFRVLLNEAELSRMFLGLMATVDYSNFKLAVGQHPDQSRQCEMYHSWWADHANLQDRPPYSGARLSDSDCWYRRAVGHTQEPTPSAPDNAEAPEQAARKKAGSERKGKRDHQRPLDL